MLTTTEVRGRLLVNASMARYSSWRAGGRAAQLFIPADLEDLADFVGALEPQVPLQFIGLGSNLLVRDGGVRGVVVRLAPGLTKLHVQAGGSVHVQAGVAAPKLARFAASRQLGGLDFMVGIPGSVGGALAMNAGCYGSETWQFVRAVTLLRRDGSVLEAGPDEFKVGYRTVRYRGAGAAVFVAARFDLAPRDDKRDDRLEQVMRQREQTQPIGTANAGSVFVNPPGGSAGQLIEAAGLSGYRVGAAQISPLHCNFIVNLGGARAADIESLIEHARSAVLAEHGVELQPEVRILGEAA